MHTGVTSLLFHFCSACCHSALVLERLETCPTSTLCWYRLIISQEWWSHLTALQEAWESSQLPRTDFPYFWLRQSLLPHGIVYFAAELGIMKFDFLFLRSGWKCKVSCYPSPSLWACCAKSFSSFKTWVRCVVHVHIKPERNVNIRLQVREVKCFQLANQRQDYREGCTIWAFSTFYFCSWFLLLLLSVLQLNWVWVLGIPHHLRLLRVQLCDSKQDNMMHTERLFNYCLFCSTFFSFGI